MFLHAFLIETLNLSSSTAHFYDPLDDRHAGIDAAVGETKKHDAAAVFRRGLGFWRCTIAFATYEI